ncbi:hypothetical protein GCM10011405_21920 [Rufibacter glacialis]|nr:hypothetical protein GCM10011405_21920 [Rufibacter glacialis]
MGRWLGRSNGRYGKGKPSGVGTGAGGRRKAPDMTATGAEDKNIGALVMASLNQNASLKNSFGKPIETQGKTIIPVAQIVL